MNEPEPDDHLFNLDESAEFLGVTTQQVEALLEAGKLSCYRVGGVYVRFRKEQLDAVKREFVDASESIRSEVTAADPQSQQPLKDSFADRMADLCYFNDFYFASLLMIGALLWLTMKT